MPSTYAKTSTGIGKLNTKVYNDNGHFAVQLYATVVYDETAETITLRTGGWNTPTTGRRIHQALRYRGHMNNVNIKGGLMHCDGKPFVNGEFVISKAA